MFARSWTYSAIEVGIMFRMNIVGPTTNTNPANAMASTMLMFESHWMPRATPETAETTKHAVRMVMIPTRMPLPTSPNPPTICSPLLICSAPIPSDAAEPKSVAKIASMSMTLPAGPSAWRPISGLNAELISWERPLRKTP